MCLRCQERPLSSPPRARFPSRRNGRRTARHGPHLYVNHQMRITATGPNLTGTKRSHSLLIQYPTQSRTPTSTPTSPTHRIPLSNNTPSTFEPADRKVPVENSFYVILSKLYHMYPANRPCQCRMPHQIGQRAGIQYFKARSTTLIPLISQGEISQEVITATATAGHISLELTHRELQAFSTRYTNLMGDFEYHIHYSRRRRLDACRFELALRPERLDASSEDLVCHRRSSRG
jgi:hypothetical protein